MANTSPGKACPAAPQAVALPGWVRYGGPPVTMLCYEGRLVVVSEIGMLRNLNVDIGSKESDGDVDYFRTLLAPEFAMRRADGTFTDRGGFLDMVNESPERRTENVAVSIFGESVAVISCIVFFSEGAKIDRFHNLRLFTRSGAGAQWQLLAWSNEKIPEVGPPSPAGGLDEGGPPVRLG